MKIKVFQINSDKDKNRAEFAGLKELKQLGLAVQPEIYNEVFDGEIDCESLEQVYNMFNLNHPLTHRGHSMSVSDVIETVDGCYFCDSMGFKKIDFDVSQTHKPDNLLRAVMVEPNKSPYATEIQDELKALQRAVCGRIEITYPFNDNAIVVSNEESKLIGMDGNRKIGGELYAGPFFIVGDKNGECCSLTDEQIEKYSKMFETLEQYTAEDVEESSGFSIYY